MPKKRKLTKFLAIPILLVIIAVAIAGFYFGFMQSTFFDDYDIEEDFLIPSSALSCKVGTCNDGIWEVWLNPNGDREVILQDDNFIMRTGQGQPTVGQSEGQLSAKYLTNLKARDIKTRVEWAGTSTDPNNPAVLEIKLNKNIILTERFIGSKFSKSTQKEFLIELLKGIENPEEFFIFVNGAEKGSIVITEETAQLEYFIRSGLADGGGSSTLTIDYIKSRPYFNCEVEADEVVIKDEFTEGTFNINDLTYEPVKFCIDSYPIVVRSFTEEGVRADIRGELTNKLARLQDITVQPDTTVQVHYIADYTEGMVERCSLDQAYNPKTSQCEKIITEQADVIEIIREVETIREVSGLRTVIVGKNQLFFKDSVTIGELPLTSTTPEYSAECDREISYDAPSPSSDCWETTVNFQGKSFQIKDNQEVTLNEWMKLKYTADARYNKETESVEDSLNIFVLTFTSFDFLELTPDENLKYITKINSNKDMTFQINNKLTNFPEAGYRILKKTDLITQTSSELVESPINQGVSTISFPLDTSLLGEIDYWISPYFKVNNDVFFISDENGFSSVHYNFKITETGTEEEPEQIVVEKPFTTSSSNFSLYVGIGVVVLALIVILSLILILRKSGKKR